jgi:hypothetical protein
VRRRVVLVLAACAVGVVAITTGASAAELPPVAARRTVERSVHQAYPDLSFGDVACPKGVKRATGVTFSCTVQLPGAFLVIDAKQTDGSGSITLSARQAVIPAQALRDFVAQNASIPATVDCGPAPWRVARPGQTVDCRAALADGTTRNVQLTVRDLEGNVEVTSVT